MVPWGKEARDRTQVSPSKRALQPDPKSPRLLELQHRTCQPCFQVCCWLCPKCIITGPLWSLQSCCTKHSSACCCHCHQQCLLHIPLAGEATCTAGRVTFLGGAASLNAGCKSPIILNGAKSHLFLSLLLQGQNMGEGSWCRKGWQRWVHGFSLLSMLLWHQPHLEAADVIGGCQEQGTRL